MRSIRVLNVYQCFRQTVNQRADRRVQHSGYYGSPTVRYTHVKRYDRDFAHEVGAKYIIRVKELRDVI